MKPEELVAKYQPLIAFLDTQEGCPKVPGYVDIVAVDDACIVNTDETIYADNPAAALDSLTVWVSEVCMWAQTEDVLPGVDMPQLIVARDYNSYWLAMGFVDRQGTTHNTYTEATLALLTAICRALGWEGEG